MSKTMKIAGQIMLWSIILIFFTIFIPHILKFEAYSIVSGSMEPELSVGEVIYTKERPFDEISVGDIIAFSEGNSIVAHRIVDIDDEQFLFTTKGDANDAVDVRKTAYTNVLGVVYFHLPVWGFVVLFFSSLQGKLVAALLVLVGTLLQLFADKVSKKQPGDDGPFSEGVEIRRQPKRIRRSYGPVLLIGVLLIVVSVGCILFILMDYKGSEDLYSDLNEEFVNIDEASDVSWDEMIDVDFDALTAINKDVIGWIYVEGTDISYPVMKGETDETYLHKDIEGNYAKAGSIFIEAFNSTDFSDYHTIIYGHNMRNLSMFGTLKYYVSETGYIDEHRYFQVLTVDGHKYRYEIFSLFNTAADSFVYAVPYGPSEEYESYIAQLCRESYIKPNVTVSKEDWIVTLSTCSAEDSRLVVNGVRVDSK